MSRKAKILLLGIIFVGVCLRLFLLSQSIDHKGYYISDTPRYLWITERLLTGEMRLSGFFYPLGLPLLFIPSWALGKTLVPVSVFFIFVFAAFAWWLSKFLTERFHFALGLFAAVFLSFDSVWLAHSILLGADFIGAVLFGAFFLLLLRLEPKFDSIWRPVTLGLLLATAAFIKPVYLWVPVFFVPILLKKYLVQTNWRRTLPGLSAFILAWTIPLLAASTINKVQGGKFSFYGHDASLYGKYIVGYILVGKNQAKSGPEGEKLAVAGYYDRLKAEAELSWTAYTLDNVLQEPKIASKLFAFSAFRTVFGNSVVDISSLLSRTPLSPPGLWKIFAQNMNLMEKIASLNLTYVVTAIMTILIKGILLLLGALGLLELIRSGRVLESASLFLLVCYFVFTPIVFGEPRYFLPATVVLLYLAAKGTGLIASRLIPSRAAVL